MAFFQIFQRIPLLKQLLWVKCSTLFSKKKIMRFFCQQAYIGLFSNINFKLMFFLP